MSQPPPALVIPLAELSAFNVNTTLGALYIGALLSTFLAGVTSIQTYVYFGRCEKDSSFFRGVIFFLWILDLIHAAFFSHAVYLYGVTFYLDPLEMLKPTWSLSVDMVVGSLNNAIITCIMMFRIWRLSGKTWMTITFIVVVAVLSVCAFVGALGVMATAFIVTTYAEFNAKYAWIWYACFGSRAAIDFAVALTLGATLNKFRSKLRKRNQLIRLLTLYVINTGAITSAASITIIATYATMPDNFITFCSTVVLPKLMLNSMLSLLNSRRTLREINHADFVSIRLSTLPSSNATGQSLENRERRVIERRWIHGQRGPVEAQPRASSVDADRSTKSETVLVIA